MTFVWPEGLAHYVQDHDVRLPEWFVTHVRASIVEREQAVVDDAWWREAAHRREPEVTGRYRSGWLGLTAVPRDRHTSCMPPTTVSGCSSRGRPSGRQAMTWA
ncbi:MAG: hypothetical protein V9G15_13025 [Dermatophilaceae bacterium]|nr:hypothetical protein [Actinomycetales bacterium]